MTISDYTLFLSLFKMKRHRTYSSWEDIHEDQTFHPMLHYKHVDTYPLPGDMLESDLPIALTLENHFANQKAEYKDLGDFTLFPLPRVEGVHLAGGSIVRFLLNHSSTLNEYDLDCFIVGPTQEIRDQRCRKFLSLLSHDVNVTMFKTYPSIIEVHKPNYPVIQVVMTMMQHMVEVVSDFDFSINRVWVDTNGKIRALPSAELSHQFLVNYISFPFYKPERIQKYSTFHPRLRTINPFPIRELKPKKCDTKPKSQAYVEDKIVPIIPGVVYGSAGMHDDVATENIVVKDWHTCFIAPGTLSYVQKFFMDPEKFDYHIVPSTRIKVFGCHFNYQSVNVFTTTHFTCRFMANQSRREILWIELVPNNNGSDHAETKIVLFSI